MTDLAAQIASLSPEQRALFEQLLEDKGINIHNELIVPISRDIPLPLSFAQQRLWFLDMLEPGNVSYNMSSAIRLIGQTNVPTLARALHALVERHEALRTTFDMQGDAPIQVIHPADNFQLTQVDISHKQLDEAELRQYALGEAQRPFDLKTGPLFRVTLARLTEEHHLLIMCMHHIVSDGWSMGVLTRELVALYQAFLEDKPNPLEPLKIQYADFAHWQRQWLQGETLQKQLEYWREKLNQIPPMLEMQTDHPRPPQQTFRGRSLTYVLLDSEELKQLHPLCQQENLSLFMLTYALFNILLYRYTHQQDIPIGTPIANRNRGEIEALIGFFVNTLVLRAPLDGNQTLREFLQEVRQTALDAFNHQDLPFEKLVEVVQPNRDMSRPPLFQVMFSFLNNPLPRQITLPNLSFKALNTMGDVAKFDLTLYIEVADEDDPFADERPYNGLVGSFEYNSDLFDKATIERMHHHYVQLLKEVIANPDRPIREFAILPEDEVTTLEQWNETAVSYPSTNHIHQQFIAQAQATPTATALRFEGQTLTYAELDQRTNQLAHHLQTLGITPDTLVGVCMERSLEMVIALIGILKAGGAYVPLDPTLPPERLSFMIADAQTAVILTQDRYQQPLSHTGANILSLEAGWAEIAQQPNTAPNIRLDDHNLAYMIYTSGSTGKPKGAMNTHAAIRNRLLWMQSAYQLTPTDTVLQKTPFSFDVSVWEFFWPLMMGSTLAIAKPEGHKDADYLLNLVAEEQVTTLHFVPSMLQLFLEAKELAPAQSIRQVICSGEALPAELQDQFFERLPHANLHNLYGPTEAAIDVSYWDCRQSYGQPKVPIGRPIANIQLHILDKWMQPVPIGVAGELYIGGVGLARGYYQRPLLTASRFVPNPFGKNGERLYRTGDLARFRPDGQIEFLGRVDFQIKLRGYRIELGEIEYVLSQQTAVQSSVIIPHKHPNTGETMLVAYYVPQNGEAIETDQLKQQLAQTLPIYMVPNLFVTLDEMPLTPNGKINRRALPDPQQEALAERKANYVAPQNEVEGQIAQIWQEILGIEQVGIHDNFFDLGGHSLLLVRVQRQLQEKTGQEIPILHIFQYPTIHALAQYLNNQEGNTFSKEKVQARAQTRLDSMQRRQQMRRRRQTRK